jgi:hypothetical protein
LLRLANPSTGMGLTNYVFHIRFGMRSFFILSSF